MRYEPTGYHVGSDFEPVEASVLSVDLFQILDCKRRVHRMKHHIIAAQRIDGARRTILELSSPV